MEKSNSATTAASGPGNELRAMVVSNKVDVVDEDDDEHQQSLGDQG